MSFLMIFIKTKMPHSTIDFHIKTRSLLSKKFLSIMNIYKRMVKSAN